jgi:hypothetical protein
MNDSKSWLAPLSGVGFILLTIIGFAVGGEPKDAKHQPAEIVKFYVDNKTSIGIGVILVGLGIILMLLFGSYLKQVLDEGAGETGILPRTAFAGLIIVAVGFAIDMTILIALSEAADDIDPVGVQALQALWDNDFIPMALGIALFNLSVGLSIVRHPGPLPKWLGWAALLFFVVGVTPLGFFAAPATALWILVASVMLTRRARATTV